ncbi:undecaprenyl-phosphate glucose phosphotransferase [Bradyrhizobium ganzhouense]|uniref:undecaprenyl-phosphate glucose phosphotransferase n=1 Tax=Bradyrhizobium ganzhouense TaxID=1179767 RepID=UPI003CE84C8C
MSIQSDLDAVRQFSRDVNSVDLPTQAVPYVLATSDAAIILLASVLGGAGYHWAVDGPLPELLPYCAVGLMASFIYILRMSGTGHYELSQSVKPGVELSNILVCWITTGLLLAFFGFLLKVSIDFSRGAFVLFVFVTPIGLLAVRKTSKTILLSALTSHLLGRTDLVLIGNEAEIAALQPEDMLAFFGAADVNRFALPTPSNNLLWTPADEHALQRMLTHVRNQNCREIVLAVPWDQTERIGLIRERTRVVPLPVRLLPDARVRSLSNYTSSARQRVLEIEIQRAPLGSTERVAKRIMDLAIASLAIAVAVPVFFLTALAIKLDGPGPVIFRQRRKGFNGREFVMFKFRTMTVQEDGAQITQACRGDARVTPIGRLLRSASVDELPQLINVLKGEMSLIGPRPHALAHDHQFQKLVGDYAFRHHVKPGLTGWAQCNGSRGATPTAEHIARRVELDLWYINNWSLWLDVVIFMKTFFELFRRRNAY